MGTGTTSRSPVPHPLTVALVGFGLEGRTVLVSRAAPAEVRGVVEALGATVVEVPLLAGRPVPVEPATDELGIAVRPNRLGRLEAPYRGGITLVDPARAVPEDTPRRDDWLVTWARWAPAGTVRGATRAMVRFANRLRQLPGFRLPFPVEAPRCALLVPDPGMVPPPPPGVAVERLDLPELGGGVVVDVDPWTDGAVEALAGYAGAVEERSRDG